MEEKLIYIIRHGETSYNVEGRVQGKGIDASLNDKGIWQAQSFYDHYKHLSFDRIYTSRLKRTKETVSPFVQNGVPSLSLYGLGEISWGIQEGQTSTPENKIVYQSVVDRWNNGDYSAKIEGGESPLELQQQQIRAFEYILANQLEKKILVCSHGRAMRVLMCTLLEQPLSNMNDFKHHNTCLYLLSYKDNKFTLVKENDHSHLVVR